MEENLKLGAYVRNGSITDDIARVSEYFPWIASRLGQHAGTLSGGEQQMLALARALMSHPRMLTFDEPSLGLAPLVTREIFRIVGELNEKEGLTVLVVEQNAAIALGSRRTRTCWRWARSPCPARARNSRATGRCARATWGIGSEFFQQVVAGLASGSICAALARARADPSRCPPAWSTSPRARWRCSRPTSPGR